MGIIGTWEGWVDNTLLLYNNGSWSYVSNPGVTYTNGLGNGVVLTPYRVVNSSTSIVWYDSIVRLNSTFNLTPYNYLKVACSVSGEAVHTTVYIGVSSSSNINSLNFSAMSSLAGGGVCISNISSISGNQYIYIGARTDYVYGYRPNVTINTITVSTN